MLVFHLPDGSYLVKGGNVGYPQFFPNIGELSRSGVLNCGYPVTEVQLVERPKF